MTLRSLVPALALIAFGLPCGLAAETANPARVPVSVAAEAPAPVVELAILLDTSSSMDGLIDQARARLWTIVNDLAKTTRNGAIPDLRVAVYEYGNSGLSSESNYIRQVIALSDDLDAVSEALFALNTNGGDEYCGAVIGRAMTDLKWTDGDHYRAIFIAGNEPFTQGPVPYAQTCKEAVSRGVVVNTIHCGNAEAGQSGMWADAARLADGTSLNIDQDRVEVAIAAPQDDRIRELNGELNKTYVAYGVAGEAKAERQMVQDENAMASAPSSFADRAAAKSSKLYSNSDWDLVDAVVDGEVNLAEMEEAALPQVMRGMSEDERKAYVAEQSKKRQNLQTELTELVGARERFVAEKRAESGEQADDTFGAAARSAIKVQLKERGYTVGE
ncbi:MAG: VWA domain-containing protein [Planctomycetota bacterium]|jgi:hypothetical protein|nr:VWA domain-containing protein [Planctomycetota bacterium]